MNREKEVLRKHDSLGEYIRLDGQEVPIITYTDAQKAIRQMATEFADCRAAGAVPLRAD